MAKTDTIVTDRAALIVWLHITKEASSAGYAKHEVQDSLDWGSLGLNPSEIQQALEELRTKGYLTMREIQRDTAGICEVFFLAEGVQTRLSLDIIPAPDPAPASEPISPG